MVRVYPFIGGKLLPRPRGRPVAYTHLDVYKRQTDDGVPTQDARRVLDACEAAHGVGVLVTLPQGEASKTLANFEMLCRVMLENGFTRKDCVCLLYTSRCV